MGYADRYFGLLEELQKLFNRKVDLVEEKAMRI
jgi:predicted nucleotidyltransferase